MLVLVDCVDFLCQKEVLGEKVPALKQNCFLNEIYIRLLVRAQLLEVLKGNLSLKSKEQLKNVNVKTLDSY